WQIGAYKGFFNAESTVTSLSAFIKMPL
ncbi:uncharacterized protein METZ01_LOCUS204244, partial [marine metagenome]